MADISSSTIGPRARCRALQENSTIASASGSADGMLKTVQWNIQQLRNREALNRTVAPPVQFLRKPLTYLSFTTIAALSTQTAFTFHLKRIFGGKRDHCLSSNSQILSVNSEQVDRQRVHNILQLL
jgi:hypothetical protein